MIRTDSELFAKINLKFSGIEKEFPASELETFLVAINSTIQFYRANVFKQLKDGEDVGYCNLPNLKGFSNLEQELFANSVILDLVSDLGNGIYFLAEDKLESDWCIEHYLGDFFRQSNKQRNQILSEIKYQRNFDRIFKEHGLFNLEEELEGLDTNQEKAEAINKYIFEFELNPEAIHYLPSNILIAKNMLSKLLIRSNSVGDVENNIREQLKESNAHASIFRENGFRLFDYLIKNHLSSGRGWKSEISFFFRIMEDSELLKCDHEAFWDFLEEKYPELEPMGKIKSLYMVDSDARRKIYSSAKKAIGLK